jgi:hypothetical protein
MIPGKDIRAEECELVQGIREPNGSCKMTYPVVLKDAAPQTSPYSLVVSSSGIIVDKDGRGRVQFAIRAPEGTASPSKLKLMVEGGDVVGIVPVAGLTAEQSDGQHKITKIGTGTLQLENLIPNTPVKLALKDGDVDASSVTRGVIQLPAVKD